MVGALICEYNPFHNGHKYMLDTMRQDGCDCIVCVMSGSFTQRGDVAVYSKFTRTESALKGGADIVIELPAVWAVASAQRFAKGGCDIIKALGCVNRVYFGSECGDITLLKAAADATLDERVNELTKEYLNKGDYYPVALQKAICELYGDNTADILSHPNNTLAIEYIKAIKDSDIEVRTIKRTGVDHDSEATTEDIASASKIRELIKKALPHSSFVPEISSQTDNPAFFEYADRALLLKMRELSTEDIAKTPDVTEGLENRIYSAAREQYTIESILNEIKTKRYTHSRLRRILTCALLGIKKEHQEKDVPYIRVLGFTFTGEQLLRKAKNTCSLPIIVNVASGYNALFQEAKEIFDIDIKATDIRTVFEKSPTPCGTDFTNGIIKI